MPRVKRKDPPVVTQLGPWRGLDTTHSPRELTSQHAVKATNVLLASGDVRPRPPWVDLGKAFGFDISNFAPAGSRLLGIYAWTSQKIGPCLLVKTFSNTFGGRLFRILVDNPVGATEPPNPDTTRFNNVLELPTGGKMSSNQCSWVPVGDRVYILDGAERPTRTDGTAEGTRLVGIRPPVYKRKTQITDADLDQVQGYWIMGVPPRNPASGGEGTETQPYLPAGKHEWAITYYGVDVDVESNPFFIPPFETGLSPSPVRRLEVYHGPFTDNLGRVGTFLPKDREGPITHVRLYRRDPPFPGFVKVGEWEMDSRHDPAVPILFDPPAITWPEIDGVPQYTLPLEEPHGVLEGTEAQGPYAPSKNGVPSMHPTVGYYYKDRFFYNETNIRFGSGAAPTDTVIYSEQGHPDHVDPGDFIFFGGDAEQGVTGMADLAGQLVVVKRSSIWLLAGTILVHTNGTIATGLPQPESSHETYRTKSTVGSLNQFGNGCIVCGNPPLLYVNSDGGFFSFNGIDERSTTKRIRPTWREFTRARNQSAARRQRMTYAVDPEREILYMCNGAQNVNRDDLPQVLAYHFGQVDETGEGAWTALVSDGGRNEQVEVIATPLGDWPINLQGGIIAREPQFHGSMLLGTSEETGEFLGFLRFQDERSDRGGLTQNLPKFEWRTGRLRLMEAVQKHFYEVRWLFEHIARDPRGNNPARRVRVAFAIDNEDPEVFDGFNERQLPGFPPLNPQHIDINVARNDYIRQAVSREGATIQLQFTNVDEDIEWSPFFGLSGFEIEYEPAGFVS